MSDAIVSAIGLRDTARASKASQRNTKTGGGRHPRRHQGQVHAVPEGNLAPTAIVPPSSPIPQVPLPAV
jgi:hypothetical protein